MKDTRQVKKNIRQNMEIIKSGFIFQLTSRKSLATFKHLAFYLFTDERNNI